MGRPRKDAAKPPVAAKGGVAKADSPKVSASTVPGPKTLPSDIVTYIIDRLAQYAGPTEIRSEIMDLFGRDVPKATINRYNPNTVQGEKEMAEALKALFFERRARYLDRLDDIPIANPAVRLQKIQSVVDRCEINGNDVLLLQAAKQAAEERGGAYTNRRELTGKDGGAIALKNEPPVELSKLSEERFKLLESIYAEAGSGDLDTGTNPSGATSA
ncbi:hypothetical protein CCAX7_54750 [Capsulimonas corticalis]|uniref:Uncharacterized protein n=1 Tax=Capsulimonas corticalis TaxID=2219043 RepID=A0A402D5P7_9BACT|nr:DUF2280 domain-containing protein [Capsulimonas corticalis]BDI33424.1 hypothetical protein CCAX7_54750 [Capsulimonas corticalis]